jgi:small subunit ribosomal protein S1
MTEGETPARLAHEYRLTKYDPARRDEHGAFMDDDWTAITDIGEERGGKTLTVADYLDIEARHLIVVASFCEESSVSSLLVDTVQDHDGLLRAKEGDRVSLVRAVEVVRLMLREEAWCRLEDPGRCYVNVGWDYYVYVGSHRSCERTLAKASELGLFVDKDFPTPYRTSPDDG